MNAEPLRHSPDNAPAATRDRRIDVRLEDTPDGRREVVLRDLDWGPGLGWYVQKTVRLDAAHVDALLGALCCARQVLNGDVAADDPTTAPCGCGGAAISGGEGEPQILQLEALKKLTRSK